MLVKTVRIMLLMEIKKFESNPEMSFEISCSGNQRTGGDEPPTAPSRRFLGPPCVYYFENPGSCALRMSTTFSKLFASKKLHSTKN